MMYKNRQKRRKEVVVNYYISCKETYSESAMYILCFCFYLAYDQLKVLVWFFYPKNKKILITKDDDDSISGVLIILL